MANKNKKRTKTLNWLTKATMRAFNYPYCDAQHINEFNIETKNAYRNIIEQLGITGPPSKPIIVTDKNEAAYKKLTFDQNDESYMTTARCLVLGYWVAHKVVYHFSKETIHYIENEIRADCFDYQMEVVFKYLCNEPIFIDMDEGFSYFCGKCAFPYHRLENAEKNGALIGIIVDDNGSYCHVSQFSKTTVREYFEDYKTNDTGRPQDVQFNRLLKALSYIFYLKTKVDAIGVAIFPNTSKPYPYFDIKPNPFMEFMPDLTTPEGWIPVGLCNMAGYLNRDTMLETMTSDLKGLDDNSIRTFAAIDDTLEMNQTQAMRFKEKLILEWERCKVVYRYNEKIVKTLAEKLQQDILFPTMSEDLLKYMPYPTIILTNPTVGQISIVSACNVAFEDRSIAPALFAYINFGGADTCSVMSFNRRLTGIFTASDDVPLRLAAFHTFMMTLHILGILKKKAIKQLAKSMLQEGNPESHDLIPLQEYVMRSQKTSDEAKTEAIRQGYDLTDEYFILNDITVRTVKRVPRKDAETRVGWRMRPHTRRSHPHRFWVGTGKERHLEVRYLKPISVNCGDRGPKSAVIHDIK